MTIHVMAVKDVYDLLRGDESPFKNYEVFMYEVPENYIKINKLPIIRITEINSYQSRFSSNKSDQFTSMVQIDLWEKSIENINLVYFAMNDFMESNGYKNVLGGVDHDIDFNNTLRMYKRYRTTKFK